MTLSVVSVPAGTAAERGSAGVANSMAFPNSAKKVAPSCYRSQHLFFHHPYPALADSSQ